MTTPKEIQMRSAIENAIYELKRRVVADLAAHVGLEHDLIDPTGDCSVRSEIATRRTARTLGTLAKIIADLEEAAK